VDKIRNVNSIEWTYSIAVLASNYSVVDIAAAAADIAS
jgi:hypothetical protein